MVEAAFIHTTNNINTLTYNNLTYIHNAIDGKDSIIVFLDLEKAFELDNKEAITSLLAQRGVAGRLLAWINDYLHERRARVQFLGHYSDFLSFENGNPQGGILSPFLLNILIADLLTINLPAETHLFAYADDLQLIGTGKHRFIHARAGLDALARRCKELGLKINFMRTRTLQTQRVIDNQWLYIRFDKIEWVTKHKCLGVFFNSQNTSSSQLSYILQRCKDRINILGRLTGLDLGAGFHVLRSFYTHAI